MSALYVQCALEWWRASGPRTAERLDALVQHYCGSYNVTDAETVAGFQREARECAGIMS